MTRRRALSVSASRLAAAALLLSLSQAAAADDPQGSDDGGAYSGDLSQLSDRELQQRTDFIVERLDDGKLYSQIWQYGFTSGYSLGVVIGAYQVADHWNDRDEKVANGAVTAGKAVFGVGRLLYAPNPGRHGADAVRAIEGDTRADREARLREAESVLHSVEHRAETRWSWKRHLSNFAINGAGAGIIAAFGGNHLALRNGLLGVSVGTVMALSMPWRGVDDAEAYRKLIRGDVVPDDPEVSWNLFSTGTGLGLRVDF